MDRIKYFLYLCIFIFFFIFLSCWFTNDNRVDYSYDSTKAKAYLRKKVSLTNYITNPGAMRIESVDNDILISNSNKIFVFDKTGVSYKKVYEYNFNNMIDTTYDNTNLGYAISGLTYDGNLYYYFLVNEHNETGLLQRQFILKSQDLTIDIIEHKYSISVEFEGTTYLAENAYYLKSLCLSLIKYNKDNNMLSSLSYRNGNFALNYFDINYYYTRGQWGNRIDKILLDNTNDTFYESDKIDLSWVYAFCFFNKEIYLSLILPLTDSHFYFTGRINRYPYQSSSYPYSQTIDDKDIHPFIETTYLGDDDYCRIIDMVYDGQYLWGLVLEDSDDDPPKTTGFGTPKLLKIEPMNK